MPTRKRHYNTLLDSLDLKAKATRATSQQKKQQGLIATLKTKADIFISALLYGALERI
ncbi:hypothetical protein [Pseudomonas sp. GM60]|uniref:hypothetical protein n=1 Tax=Pseudomonas sp. GM60 TaxID=1144334 RepID=UPI0002F12CFB|nr:hypothetical protein [Pseudomonas sp. GM60]